MREKSLITGCIILLFAVAAVAAPCLADDGTIYGCAGKAIGYLRIVSSPSACTKHETLVLLAKPSEPTDITRALHGTVDNTGSFTGSGFSVAHVDYSGVYVITFDSAFDNVPDCLYSPYGNVFPYIECVNYTAVTKESVSVACHTYGLVADINSYGYDNVMPVSVPQDASFSFICVQ